MLRKLFTFHVGLLALIYAAIIPGQSFAQMSRGMMTPQMRTRMNQGFVPQMNRFSVGANGVFLDPRFNTLSPRADIRLLELRQELLIRGFDQRLIDRRLNALNPNSFDQRLLERRLLRDQQLLIERQIRGF